MVDARAPTTATQASLAAVAEPGMLQRRRHFPRRPAPGGGAHRRDRRRATEGYGRAGAPTRRSPRLSRFDQRPRSPGARLSPAPRHTALPQLLRLGRRRVSTRRGADRRPASRQPAGPSCLGGIQEHRLGRHHGDASRHLSPPYLRQRLPDRRRSSLPLGALAGIRRRSSRCLRQRRGAVRDARRRGRRCAHSR